LLLGLHPALDVGAGFRQKGLQDGAGRFLVQPVLGVRRLRGEGFFQERDADPLGAAHIFQGGGSPRPAFHHLGKQGQPDANDLVFPGQAGHGLAQELPLLSAHRGGARRKSAEGTPKSRQHLPGVVEVEQVGQGRVLTLEQIDLQFDHEPRRRQPEIVSHHHHALDAPAVTLPQGLHQLRVLLFLPGVQPLLELVQDDQHLLARRQALPAAQGGQGFFQPQIDG
jgi:hypothetical protein